MNVEVALMIVVALQIAFNVLMAYLLSCLNREAMLLHERIDVAEAAIGHASLGGVRDEGHRAKAG